MSWIRREQPPLCRGKVFKLFGFFMTSVAMGRGEVVRKKNFVRVKLVCPMDDPIRRAVRCGSKCLVDVFVGNPSLCNGTIVS